MNLLTLMLMVPVLFVLFGCAPTTQGVKPAESLVVDYQQAVDYIEQLRDVYADYSELSFFASMVDDDEINVLSSLVSFYLNAAATSAERGEDDRMKENLSEAGHLVGELRTALTNYEADPGGGASKMEF